MMNHENSLASHAQNDPLPRQSTAALSGVLEFARRVERISREIDEFLVAQFEALELALRKRQEQRPNLEASQKDAEAVARQKAEWEREKRAMLEKLETDRKCLTEAWGRLEMEQRKLLAERATFHHAPSTVSHPATTGHSGLETAPASLARGSSQSLESPPQEPSDTEANSELEKAVRQSVLMQFQQLKNDVRSHAHRRHSR